MTFSNTTQINFCGGVLGRKYTKFDECAVSPAISPQKCSAFTFSSVFSTPALNWIILVLCALLPLWLLFFIGMERHSFLFLCSAAVSYFLVLVTVVTMSYIGINIYLTPEPHNQLSTSLMRGTTISRNESPSDGSYCIDSFNATPRQRHPLSKRAIHDDRSNGNQDCAAAVEKLVPCGGVNGIPVPRDLSVAQISMIISSRCTPVSSVVG